MPWAAAYPEHSLISIFQDQISELQVYFFPKSVHFNKWVKSV